MAVLDDVRPLGSELERSYEVFVHGRLKFRVQQIVYVAFSLDERVMGFASPDQVEEFFKDVPEFERMLVRSGVTLIKYWFSITDEEQQLRFLMRIHDPMKQWKLSPMDLESRVKWEDYTKAKEEMFARTNIPEAPWYIVEGNDKKPDEPVKK